MPPKGTKMSEETKQKISKTLRGHPVTQKTIDAVREANTGSIRGPRTQEVKDKISKANKGRKYSQEIRDAMSKRMKGRTHTEEQKAKVSATMKGIVFTEEHRKHLSEANKGKHLTEEAKKKVGAASKGRKFSKEVHELWSKQRSGAGNSAWKGGLSFGKYCPKFTEKLKEEIRERHRRKCLICGTPENGEHHSVHHINFDKSSGCFGKKWNLAPLCRKPCHTWTSFRRWQAFNLLQSYWALDCCLDPMLDFGLIIPKY